MKPECDRSSALLVLNTAGCGLAALATLPVKPLTGDPDPVATPAAPHAAPGPEGPRCARRAPRAACRAAGDAARGSTLALARAGDREIAYVADEDERAVRTIDLASGVEIALRRSTPRPDSSSSSPAMAA